MPNIPITNPRFGGEPEGPWHPGYENWDFYKPRNIFTLIIDMYIHRNVDRYFY